MISDLTRQVMEVPPEAVLSFMDVCRAESIHNAYESVRVPFMGFLAGNFAGFWFNLGSYLLNVEKFREYTVQATSQIGFAGTYYLMDYLNQSGIDCHHGVLYQSIEAAGIAATVLGIGMGVEMGSRMGRGLEKLSIRARENAE